MGSSSFIIAEWPDAGWIIVIVGKSGVISLSRITGRYGEKAKTRPILHYCVSLTHHFRKTSHSSGSTFDHRCATKDACLSMRLSDRLAFLSIIFLSHFWHSDNRVLEPRISFSCWGHSDMKKTHCNAALVINACVYIFHIFPAKVFKFKLRDKVPVSDTSIASNFFQYICDSLSVCREFQFFFIKKAIELGYWKSGRKVVGPAGAM